MKPDKKTCLNCGDRISTRATYCSDKCRMAYIRNPNKAHPEPEHKGEQTQPEHANPNIRDSLTKTDKTFYDRAMRDFNEPYYKFNEIDETERTCLDCGEKFKTRLSLLRFCSYAHYSDSLAGKHG